MDAKDARAYVPVLACLTLLATVLAAFQVIGVGNRRYSEGHRHYEVASSRDGYLLLRRLGLRGRVVVIFDETAHILRPGTSEFVRTTRGRDESALITPDNFVEGFIYSDIAREIWVVVPESEWLTVADRMSAHGGATITSGSVVSRLCGVRVTYVTPESLPRFGEKVVAYVPEGIASEYAATLLSAFDEPGVSDVYVVQRGR